MQKHIGEERQERDCWGQPPLCVFGLVMGFHTFVALLACNFIRASKRYHTRPTQLFLSLSRVFHAMTEAAASPFTSATPVFNDVDDDLPLYVGSGGTVREAPTSSAAVADADVRRLLLCAWAAASQHGGGGGGLRVPECVALLDAILSRHGDGVMDARISTRLVVGTPSTTTLTTCAPSSKAPGLTETTAVILLATVGPRSLCGCAAACVTTWASSRQAAETTKRCDCALSSPRVATPLSRCCSSAAVLTYVRRGLYSFGSPALVRGRRWCMLSCVTLASRVAGSLVATWLCTTPHAVPRGSTR